MNTIRASESLKRPCSPQNSLPLQTGLLAGFKDRGYRGRCIHYRYRHGVLSMMLEGSRGRSGGKDTDGGKNPPAVSLDCLRLSARDPEIERRFYLTLLMCSCYWHWVIRHMPVIRSSIPTAARIMQVLLLQVEAVMRRAGADVFIAGSARHLVGTGSDSLLVRCFHKEHVLVEALLDLAEQQRAALPGGKAGKSVVTSCRTSSSFINNCQIHVDRSFLHAVNLMNQGRNIQVLVRRVNTTMVVICCSFFFSPTRSDLTKWPAVAIVC